MAVLKTRDIKNMSDKEKKDKLDALRVELMKKNTPANKSSKVRNKEIKKAIARILTLNHGDMS